MLTALGRSPQINAGRTELLTGDLGPAVAAKSDRGWFGYFVGAQIEGVEVASGHFGPSCPGGFRSDGVNEAYRSGFPEVMESEENAGSGRGLRVQRRRPTKSSSLKSKTTASGSTTSFSYGTLTQWALILRKTWSSDCQRLHIFVISWPIPVAWSAGVN